MFQEIFTEIHVIHISIHRTYTLQLKTNIYYYIVFVIFNCQLRRFSRFWYVVTQGQYFLHWNVKEWNIGQQFQ